MREEIKTQCPECESGMARHVEKRRQDDEVTATLMCEECGNEWTRVLRFE